MIQVFTPGKAATEVTPEAYEALLKDQAMLDELIAFNNVKAIARGDTPRWCREYIGHLLDKAKE